MKLVGMKVTGFWGAMFPWSYGEIVNYDGCEVAIEWDDDEIGKSYVMAGEIKAFDWVNGPG